MSTYDVTIEAVITVRVDVANTPDDENEAGERAMAALDALATDQIRMGNMICTDTKLVREGD
jgi:hypothetical protein